MIFITAFSIIKYCVLSMFRVYLHNKASRLAWDWFILLDTFPVKLHYTSFYSPSGLHYKTIFLYVISFSVPRYLSCFGYEGNAFSAVFLLDLFAFLWDGEPSFYLILPVSNCCTVSPRREGEFTNHSLHGENVFQWLVSEILHYHIYVHLQAATYRWGWLLTVGGLSAGLYFSNKN